MGHDVASLGDSAVTGAVLPVAQHAIIAFGGIVNPSIEVAQHTGVDGCEEVEEVLREVEITACCLVLIPVDEILRHPYLLTLLCEVLIGRADASILVAAIDVEAGQHVGLVQFVDVAVGTAYRLGGDDLTADLASVGLHKLGHLGGCPLATGVVGRPVGLVLDGYGIQLHTVLSQVLHVLLQVCGIVGPVLPLQRTHDTVIVLGINRIVGLPFCWPSPGRGKEDESQLLCQLGCGERLSP